ncbi:hypothetical protein PRZ48_006143 [Zasmidium cellare]|uniref:Maleylacetoacetate isomerase n=1 Tax=Zasmidium cellare TaxID=395010 RepID=A0ABR0EMK8_ZASCE|nr:hypothetical protein PRZ48_006143 [Zasmidium cellare]
MGPQTISNPFDGELVLYTYFRSSCSCRVRTACQLKGIPLTYRFVNLLKGEQQAQSYLDEVNPNGLVPTLVIKDASGDTMTTISQSVAILEFLEDIFPSKRSLLPPDPLQRARVRELVNIIACDMQPPTNLRILKRVNGLGVSNQEWFREFMERPLAAYEKILGETTGKFSVGDEVSLADVCLAPAIENALRWDVDMARFPRVMKVFKTIKELPEFKAADWRHQEDTPENLRGKD